MSISEFQVLERLVWELEEPIILLNEAHTCLAISKGFVRSFGDALGVVGEEEVEKQNRKSSQLISHESLSDFWPDQSTVSLKSGLVRTQLNFGGELRRVEAKCVSLSAKAFLFSFSYSEKEKSFFHQQRLQTLGMLAGGVAHDFNNILAGILGHITFLQAVLPSEGAHCESLEAITDGAKKASELTKQILDFSKFEVAEENSVVGISGLVESTAPLLRGALTSRVRLELDLPKNEVYVKGSEGKLAQVLVNLVINARDAVSQNGVVRVKVRDATPEECVLFQEKKGIESVRSLTVLDVADNGMGMSEQVKQRALEPYFSTKGAQGTGLGLATVASITEAHDGFVHIESREGEGASVLVFLQKLEANGSSSAKSGDGQNTDLPRGDERILVVDDEEAVRNVVAMSLRHLGYSVVEFSDPREAKALLDLKKDRIHLVVLDMLMPHLSGEELFNVARKNWSELPVLVMSGYSEEGAIQRILDEPLTSFIQKPFTVEDLSVSVRHALDRNAREGAVRKGSDLSERE